jgi:hypothetical protein
MSPSAPPELGFADIEPLQDYYHDGSGNYYSVARLVDEAKDLKPFDAPLAALDLSGEIWSGCNIFSLAYHCKKVKEADLSYPIILDWNGSIADGRHRVIKALVEGMTTIKAVRITWTMTPCRRDDD